MDEIGILEPFAIGEHSHLIPAGGTLAIFRELDSYPGALQTLPIKKILFHSKWTHQMSDLN